MRPIVLVPFLVAFAAVLGCQREPAQVADTQPSPAATPSAAPALQTPAVTEFEGRGSIASIDRSSGTVTLDSEPIADLGWSSRTVTVAVDESLAKDLEPGDTVDFTLRQDKGRLVLSAIEPGSTLATAETESD